MNHLTYVVVTPARDEEANLRRLAPALLSQTVRPARWIVVDGGSTDDSAAFVSSLAATDPFVELVGVAREAGTVRGAPIVRAFRVGLEALETDWDVVVKLDADVSMAPDYFEHLLEAFAEDPRLGIASGSAYEWQRGSWRQRHMTRTSVWGACRAYRRECLADVLPLEERMGWDSVDEFRANVRGWRTRTLLDLPFRHHRAEGYRDGSRLRSWRTQGQLAHFLGYRPSYLLARAAYKIVRDPFAIGLLAGYARAALTREARCADAEARAYLRRQQKWRRLPARAREALGRTVG